MRAILLCSALCAMLSGAGRATAQNIGTLAAERARLAEITGDSSLLMRAAPDTVVLPGALSFGRWTAVRPSLRLVWNSELPASGNDGALWAGVGWSASSSFGVEGSVRARNGALVRLSLAPVFFYSQNEPFPLFPNRTEGRSGWANPFHGPDASLDLPHRFGDRALRGYDYGNTGVSFQWRGVAIGATTSEAWWGPGIRNAIVLSNNAPGIPRIFARAANPVRTPLGRVQAELFTGTLTKSRFFRPATGDHRTIGGLRLELVPAADSALTIGFARAVYRAVDHGESGFLKTLERAAYAVAHWETVGADQDSDQISALFARWFFPAAGLEIYGEFARMGLPSSATELLTAPDYSGGWTLGTQWAPLVRAAHRVRLQAEFTYLEQSVVFPDRPTPDFYSGRGSAEGYTQRGQVIGASTGPGSSTQFIAADWIAPAWQLGAFVNRTRWDNDAMYREIGVTFYHHDVSVAAGVRGGWRTRYSDFSAEFGVSKRFNYLFQNGFASPPGFRTVDMSNVTLVLAATPR